MARVIRGGARVVRASAGGGHQTRELIAGLAELSAARARLREGASSEIGTLALDVASRVIGERVAVDTALLERIVLRALQRARADSAVRVLLHPADRALLAPRFGDHPDIVLVDDPTQARGGCLVRGALVTVDARVETAIAAIAQALGVERPT